MFYDMRSSLVETVQSTVIYPEFEEREEWIDSHQYDPTNVNWANLDVSRLKRDNAILKYYPIYTIDNVYEYYVFRSCIVHLNKLGGLTGNDEFTLGHYIPFKKGGVHFPSNWIIQTQRDNSHAGDNVPEKKEKWAWEEQEEYILKHLPEDLNGEYAAITMRRMLQVMKFY